MSMFLVSALSGFNFMIQPVPHKFIVIFGFKLDKDVCYYCKKKPDKVVYLAENKIFLFCNKCYEEKVAVKG